MSLRIEPISPEIGANIFVAPDVVLDEGIPEQLLDALEKYSVLVLPENGMDDTTFTAMAKAMGPAHDLGVTAEEGSEETEAGVYRVALDKDDQTQLDFVRGNDWWHMDGTVYDTPGKATLLKCESPPKSGGDTGFAKLDAAWNALPKDKREKLEGLTVRHAFRAVGKLLYGDVTEEQVAMWDNFFPPTEHPLVWHRTSGETSLLIGSTAYDIPGMADAEARALLDELYDFVTQDRFTYRHQWKKGDVVIFHNPALLHRSFPYDKEAGRLMHRTTIAGTEAIA
ncbi:TauD/TfdA family dioxygenase [Erythrobacter alti]|uniref:TauD/TfdA dioxygenase family protein n=1 Tax=Erythrobacter alti TaxID=1896145 RepID=UPI0030F41D69